MQIGNNLSNALVYNLRTNTCHGIPLFRLKRSAEAGQADVDDIFTETLSKCNRSGWF